MSALVVAKTCEPAHHVLLIQLQSGQERAPSQDIGVSQGDPICRAGAGGEELAAAHARMKAMEFTDNSGWLSSLRRARNGDVGSLLNTIESVR